MHDLFARFARAVANNLLPLAEKCGGVDEDTGTAHLVWMCNAILEHAHEWRRDKTNRWIGYVQGVLVAKRMTTVIEQRRLISLLQAVHGIDEITEPVDDDA